MSQFSPSDPGSVYVRHDLRPGARQPVSAQQAPDTLEAAYRAILSQSPDGAQWRGWKLGGTNHATQAAFGVTRGYFGALDASEILHQPAQAPGLPLCEIKGEVEIALRLNADASGYDAWAVSLEMPASAVTNLPDAGVEVLVADRCGAGALVLGPVQTGALPDLSDHPFSLDLDGETVSAARPADTLVDTPQALLADFLTLARDVGASPRPGDWVATGGITACCDFRPGQRVTVTCGDAVALDFEVTVA